MAPRRKPADHKLKSIWDETLITNLFHQHHASLKNMYKMWKWMIAHPNINNLYDIPFQTWCIPKLVIQEILENYSYFTTKIIEQTNSIRGDTTKLLIELQDFHCIETVVIQHRHHTTVCISSQVGCQMGCKFCATGTMGIIGDLTSAEIIEQVVHANKVSKVRNIVYMGMGEPLKNYENLKISINFLIDTKRFALSPRHVTVSTVGVLKAMKKLTEECGHVNLALSLHAPNQDIRLKIVPTAVSHPIEKLLEAVDYHILIHSRTQTRGGRRISSTATMRTTNRVISDLGYGEKKNEGEEIIEEEEEMGEKKKPLKVTSVMIEYILIKDINDRDEHAHELCRLLAPRRDHVLLNLIPYNPTDVPGQAFEAPTQDQINSFYQICTSDEHKIFSRVRQEMGQDIAGACGQLALKSAASTVTSSVSSSGHESGDIEDIMNRPSSSSTSVEKRKTERKKILTSSSSPVVSSTSTPVTVTNVSSSWSWWNQTNIPFLSYSLSPWTLLWTLTLTATAAVVVTGAFNRNSSLRK
jgi:adenine C2-methylase RlmN of 23S rRNA A2503 and tRNA A37